MASPRTDIISKYEVDYRQALRKLVAYDSGSTDKMTHALLDGFWLKYPACIKETHLQRHI